MNMRASRQSLAPLRARWNALAPREQNMTLLAGGVVALALLWWVALAPALHSLRTAPERHAQADRQLRQMHHQAASEAKATELGTHEQILQV